MADRQRLIGEIRARFGLIPQPQWEAELDAALARTAQRIGLTPREVEQRAGHDLTILLELLLQNPGAA
jgi:hypothetical protein